MINKYSERERKQLRADNTRDFGVKGKKNNNKREIRNNKVNKKGCDGKVMMMLA